MKNSDLIHHWSMPDNTRVTSKQLSIRLPVHVAAKVSALCDLFPNKTRTEIIGDLLTQALNDIEYSFPSVKGERDGVDEEGNAVYIDVGLGAQFMRLSNQYYEQFEKELGNENPNKLFPAVLVITDKDAS